MHGGQAIPAFDYYLAPYVKLTFIEEIKKIEELLDKDLSKLYDYQPKDYIKKDLKGLTGEERDIQAAINNTVSRVHQAMEAFIHNMNTIHSRGDVYKRQAQRRFNRNSRFIMVRKLYEIC